LGFHFNQDEEDRSLTYYFAGKLDLHVNLLTDYAKGVNPPLHKGDERQINYFSIFFICKQGACVHEVDVALDREQT